MKKKVPKESGIKKSRNREVIGILFIFFSVFLILSLVTHDKGDWPGSSREFGEPTQNFTGRSGAYISHVFFENVGYTSFAFSIFLLVTGIVFFLHKGLKYLIKAIPDVLSQVQVTLLIAGEFWKDKNAYLRLIRRLKLEKRIIIIDEYIPNEDVGAYFRAADLVVQPYVSATGSGVVQVAYGFGRPVIATSISSLEEVVEDETTGYLVPPGDSKALAGAIIRFFREGKAKVFSQNIEKRKHRYSWEKMVHTIEDAAVSSPARKDPA